MQDFPDVEDALCEVLESVAPTGTATDEDFAIPIRVNRTGGGADRLGLQDAAIVTVTCFAEAREVSKALNRQVRQRLARARLLTTAAGLIDSVTETTAPLPLPGLNPDMRKVESTWTVVSRLQEIPTTP